MTAGQPGELDIDKLRKLQEMKQQEEEFDKHLAQTVPVRQSPFVIYKKNILLWFRIFLLRPSASLNPVTLPL